MVTVATGLWWDQGQSLVQRPTLTLPIELGNRLLAGLTLLVTLATASLWNISAFALHAWKTKRPGPVSVVDLQHQVLLRNARGPLGMLWDAAMIHRAWSKKRQPGLLLRTCSLAVPACLIWAYGVVAAIFVSSVANKSYGSVIARAQPNICGFWGYNTSSIEQLAASKRHSLSETQKARTYVNTFYANASSSSAARSIFTRTTLPYNVTTSAPCPDRRG